MTSPPVPIIGAALVGLALILGMLALRIDGWRRRRRAARRRAARRGYLFEDRRA